MSHFLGAYTFAQHLGLMSIIELGQKPSENELQAESDDIVWAYLDV